MQLSIIIINFNTKNLLKNCLNSITQNIPKNSDMEIIVVDNASKDDSVTMLKKEFPFVLLIENNINLGFAAANNQGIQKAKGEFILLLNSDTILEKGSLKSSLEVMKKKENIGVLGCQLKNKDGSLQYSAGFLPNLINIYFWMKFIDDIPFINRLLYPYHIGYPEFYSKSQEIGWVSGAFFLLRKKAFDEVGLFDENLFMYGEEVEFCLRLQKKDWQVFYFKDAQITHLKGASGNKESSGLVEEFTALIYIWKKHYPQWQYPILLIALKFGALLRLLLFGIILRDRYKLNIYAKAFKMA